MLNSWALFSLFFRFRRTLGRLINYNWNFCWTKNSFFKKKSYINLNEEIFYIHTRTHSHAPRTFAAYPMTKLCILILLNGITYWINWYCCIRQCVVDRSISKIKWNSNCEYYYSEKVSLFCCDWWRCDCGWCCRRQCFCCWWWYVHGCLWINLLLLFRLNGTFAGNRNRIVWWSRNHNRCCNWKTRKRRNFILFCVFVNRTRTGPRILSFATVSWNGIGNENCNRIWLCATH